MKIRIKFRKYGALKFVGHLDMMRYFQKALKRAGIDMKYSEGFNPHMIMSFAAPLGVGITSDGEYFDIEVLSTKSTAESLKVLNEAMVEGVEVTSYVALPDTAKKSMSLVAAADYEIFYKEGYEIPRSVAEFTEIYRNFYEKQSEILIVKKTKKSEKTMDIKPMIHVFRGEGDGCFMNVATGSTQNLKPEQVMATLYQFSGREFDPFTIYIHREETYGADFKPLEAYGNRIL